MLIRIQKETLYQRPDLSGAIDHGKAQDITRKRRAIPSIYRHRKGFRYCARAPLFEQLRRIGISERLVRALEAFYQVGGDARFEMDGLEGRKLRIANGVM